MKSRIIDKLLFLTLSLSITAGVTYAVEIKGVVKDAFGRPMAGVKVESGGAVTLTSMNGRYTLDTKTNVSSPITFSKIGYASVTTDGESNNNVNVSLKTDVHQLDRTVYMGYSSQSKNSVSGAVVSVDGETLDMHPTINLLQTLPGNLTGLNYYENNNNLFNSSVGMSSRGISTLSGRNILVVVDGIVSTSDEYKYITPQEIESVTYLKDASSTTIYGIQGANGVIVITTKRGISGKPSVTVKYNSSLQHMTNRPMSVNSWEYATLRNQAAYNDNNAVGHYSQFSKETVEGFMTGGEYYPNNNWVDMYLRDFTTLQRVGVDVAGGSEKIRYYSMLGYAYQDSQFSVDKSQTKYDAKPYQHLIKARTNIDMNFNKYLSGYATISANILNNRLSIAPNDNDAENSSLIYERLLYMPPTTYGPTTLPNGLGEVVATEKETNPVYGILNRSGYNIRTSTNVASKAGLKLDMSFLLEGLSVSGAIAFKGVSTQMQKNSMTYQRQVRNLAGGYGTLNFANYGSEVNGVLQNANSGNFTYDLNYYGHIDYVRNIGKHSVKLNMYTHYLKEVLASSMSGVTVMPYIRHTMGAELQYGYADKYFVKGDFAYAGSDQFARKNRYAALPAVSAAWVVSKEDFMKPLKGISYLKLRASYGITANDQFSGGGRFLYLDYISSYGAENLIGNPNLYAERLRNQNYGFDLGLWNALNVSFDYFIVQNNHMLISTNNIYPNYMGANNTSITNQGRMDNRGFELNVDYSKEFNDKWSATIGAGVSYAKNKVRNVSEIARPDYYCPKSSEGYAAGAIFGYRVDYSTGAGNGFINTQEQLDHYTPMYVAGGIGAPRLGDLIYQDLNKDGRIGVEDVDYLGTTIPEFFYSLSGTVRYKSLKLYIQLEGAAKGKAMMTTTPNRVDGIFTDLHMNAWTAERFAAGDKITYPALYISNSPSNNSSDYFLNDISYLALRNVTLTYTLPSKITKVVGISKLDVSLSAENLCTIDRMKSDYFDPRVRSTGAFQPYRIFNLGLNLTF